jgi:hypothetical protein
MKSGNCHFSRTDPATLEEVAKTAQTALKAIEKQLPSGFPEE